MYRAVSAMSERLEGWREEVVPIEKLTSAPQSCARSAPMKAFLASTLGNVLGSLVDLGQLTEAISIKDDSEGVCHLFTCPRLTALRDALIETAGILPATGAGRPRACRLARRRRVKWRRYEHRAPTYRSRTRRVSYFSRPMMSFMRRPCFLSNA